MDTLLSRAKAFAKAAHEGTNHTYDGKPYFDLHVEEYVFKWALRFIYLVPENVGEEVLAAVYCHDVEEDCRMTYNDVKKATNERVANIVHALTNEKGKVRSERANNKYYKGILDEPYAILGKLADRLGNVEYSMTHGEPTTRQNSMYRKEYDHFRNSLYKDYHYAEMWHELDKMIYSNEEMNELRIGRLVKVHSSNEHHLPLHDTFVVTGIRTRLITIDSFSGIKKFMTFVDVLNLKDKTEMKDVEIDTRITLI